MSKKKNKSKDLDLLIEITNEEATFCYINYDVDFKFCHYSGDVETVYVRAQSDSQNSVEFYMLETLQKRLQEINPRYRVGIIYTEK